MKRIGFVCAILLAAISSTKAEVEFAYEAGAEIVSAYLWRGQYNGGLSFQPDVEVGYDGEHTSLRFGAWGSVGASDWAFYKNLPMYPDGSNPNTYFVPELDLMLNFQVAGVILGATHYYYFGGSPFFNWGKFDPINGSAGTSQTEVTVGYDFRDKCEVPLTFTWNTMVAGNDLNEEDDGTYKRAFSSYMEIKYDQPLPFEMTLSLALGMSPWRSDNVYGNEKFAVTNISARLEKSWEFDACELILFGQGMLNTNDINKSNVFVWAAGDDKVCVQRLNGTIGLGVWF